jgi:restriction system protein
MKWKMAENSVFAILLRSRWWVSALVAAGVFGVVRIFMAWGYALFAISPFIVIAVVAAWRQIRVPSGTRLEKALHVVRAMTWEEFARALEAGFDRQGYTVKRVTGAADFELERAGRVSLVCARRWKASVCGVEPLKELVTAGEKLGAQELRYAAAGELTQQAREFAQQESVQLVEGADLVELVKR